MPWVAQDTLPLKTGFYETRRQLAQGAGEKLALSPGCVTLEDGIWEAELTLIQECLWSFQVADDMVNYSYIP